MRSGEGKGDSTRSLITRWTPLSLIVIAGGLTLYALHAGLVVFTGKPSRDILIVIGLAELFVYLWARVYSRLRFANQLVVLGVFVAVQAALYFAVRLDGFTGDGRPIWKWRWTLTPQETFARSRQQSPVDSPPADETIDLANVTASDYPAFRGRDRSGRATATRIDPDWKARPPKELWRQSVGSGWSSFAVVGDYCVTQEQRGEEETTVCYRVQSGREVWSHADRARFLEPTGGEGPRATPTIQDGRVYALGATGILNCLDGATGAPIWTVDILDDNGIGNRLFGMAGSPLVVDSLVIVSPGGKGSSLVAYDRSTGERVWKGGDAGASYSSPHYAKLRGQAQILSFNAEGLFAHDSRDGRLLWNTPWISNPAERNNVCQPVVWRGVDEDDNYVFISSAYDKGSALFEISGGNGEPFSTETRWQNRHLKAKFSSVVMHRGCVYGLDNAILTCLDISTGERRWKGGHYGYGQLILAGEHLLVQLESGEVALVDASPQAFREIARLDALPGRTWNHPAVAGRYLIVRNDREAACFELPVRQ